MLNESLTNSHIGLSLTINHMKKHSEEKKGKEQIILLFSNCCLHLTVTKVIPHRT